MYFLWKVFRFEERLVFERKNEYYRRRYGEKGCCTSFSFAQKEVLTASGQLLFQNLWRGG